MKLIFMLRLGKLNINKIKLISNKRADDAFNLPSEQDPTVITDVPTGKVCEPEDVINGTQFDSPLEPEDM